MTARSILEIDVQDEAFQRFQAEWGKFQAAVDSLPGAWGKIGRAMDGASHPLDRMEERLSDSLACQREMLDVLKGVQQTTTKIAEGTSTTADAAARAAKSQNDFASNLARAQRTMAALAHGARSMSSDLRDSVETLVKWTGISGAATAAAGGLLGLGGIWGIDRLASGASDLRRTSSGLGVTPGQQQALQTNLQRITDPSAFLQGVADAQSDRANPVFRQLGISNARGMGTADLAVETLRQLKRMWDGSDHTQQYAEGHGMLSLASMGTLRTLGNMSWGEFNQLAGRIGADSKRLDVPDETLRKWQDFSDQMTRAGREIKTALIDGLGPLEPELKDLSHNFSEAVSAFLKSPSVKAGLDDLDEGLKSLTAWFKNQPWNDTKKVPIDPAAEAAHPTGLGRWLYRNFDRLREPDNWLFGSHGGQGSRAHEAAKWLDAASTRAKEDTAAAEAGVDAWFARAIFVEEAGINPDGSPRVSSAGAIGPGQLMPGTAKDLGANPWDTEQNIKAAVTYMKSLEARYGDKLKAAAAYNWGPGNLDNDIALHGEHWRDWLPRETRRYVNGVERQARGSDGTSATHTSSGSAPSGSPKRLHVTVTNQVLNNTGGSATISGSQVAVQ